MIESRNSPPYTIQPLRRLLSILLLAVTALAAVSPLFALTPMRTGLPACCRKNGKHHCEGSVQVSSEKTATLTALADKCPYSPVTAANNHSNDPALASRQSIWIAPAIHSALLPNMQSKHYSAAASLQHKRGPPTFFL
jgi:hypothetical protein